MLAASRVLKPTRTDLTTVTRSIEDHRWLMRSPVGKATESRGPVVLIRQLAVSTRMRSTHYVADEAAVSAGGFSAWNARRRTEARQASRYALQCSAKVAQG